MSSPEHWFSFLYEQPLVEGVGNEVLVTFSVICGLLIILFAHIIYTRPPLASDVGQIYGLRDGILPQDEITRRIEEARNRADQTCAICIGNASYTVLTNCSHIFCCECMHRYWDHRGTRFSPVSCAICRTVVTMLLPVNWPSREGATSIQTLETNAAHVDDYNRRFCGNRSMIDYLWDLPQLIPFILRSLMGFNGLLIMFRVRVVLILAAILAYILMPLDIFPENTYGLIGFLDDIFVVVLMAIYMAIAFRHFIIRRGEQQQQHN